MSNCEYDFDNGDPLRGFKEANDYIAHQLLKNEKVNKYPVIFDNLDAVRDAAEYLKSHFSIKRDANILSSHRITNGTTDAFSSVIRVIPKHNKRFCKYVGFKEKPVLLMPVPNYGVFHEIAKREGYEIWPIKRNERGTPDYEDLKANLERSLEEKRYVAAFFDSNPNNPTGAIRTKEETKKIADLFVAFNKKYQELSDNKAQAEYKLKNPNAGEMSEYELEKSLLDLILPSGPDGKSYIIDDLVYMGTEYDKNADMGIFLELDKKNYSKYSITLMGPSKIGLANIRAGVMFFPDELAQDIEKDLFFRYCGVSPSLADAVTAVYGKKHSKKYLENRENHIRTMAEDCKERGLMMKALFNGLNNTIKDAKERKKIREEIKQNTPRGEKGKVDVLLKQGIKHATVITSPQAGFFHLINFESLRGKYFEGYKDPFLKSIRINESRNLSNYLYQNDIELRPPERICLPKTDLTYCATFAKNKEDIVGFALALDNALQKVVAPKR